MEDMEQHKILTVKDFNIKIQTIYSNKWEN